MFINISNHPSAKWSPEQLAAALDLAGEEPIRDVQFPNVNPTDGRYEVMQQAYDLVAYLYPQEGQ